MSDIFDEVFELPDPDRDDQFQQLVGLDHTKDLLVKQGTLLLNPVLLDEWSTKHHKAILPAVNYFKHRPPLLIFSGDVGTGKTSLAESFGSVIARRNKIKITVVKLSLTSRGTGAVGEMTTLISRAFEEVQSISGQGKRNATIFIIDEADAIAQSREFDQMHHEDRAGVNALIRGIDRFTIRKLPVLVLMCTNRLKAIDPAVVRRAAHMFTFDRPNVEQRLMIFKQAFNTIIPAKGLRALAEQTGKINGREFGYTYSDLTQRFIPTMLLEAFPDKPITFDLARDLITKMEPTKQFFEMK